MTLFRRLFVAALVAGVLSGTAASVVQRVTTVPLILEAERYEVVTTSPPVAPTQLTPAAPAHAGHDGAGHAAHPAPVRELGEAVPETAEEAFQRLWLTVATNLLVGIGYALLVAGAMLLVRAPVDARRGLVWGLGGFIAFALAPATGLPPELPGMGGAELEARQIWWLAAAFCATAGLFAVAFARNRLVVAAGVVVAALPHLVGAPHPESAAGAVPPEMAARFAVLSLGTAALFWALLGSACGAMMQRVLGRPDEEA
ncbi:CbtA family protein [Azospirillum thermophilum]|uniref:Cobalt transporter n=1 Tax=Azospirillum thermophilum TaxID=2202148 RepID=A0A2S2CK26_9PROT|nr:CbtA family protein [Azospirillum thermophilum]AWK84858.1 cobalt transporter [Azospirillum thermophilum]